MEGKTEKGMNAMEYPVKQAVRCSRIIGRTPEFAALGALVEQTRVGQGHLALVAGEAGIGKSRLVSELKTTAMAQGFLVMQGICFPTDLTYPYAPVLDLLRALVASNLNASLTAEVRVLARETFPLLPELVPDQAILPPRLEPEQEKRRLFAVLATFFLRLSAQTPVLLIIEDVHWSDDTSLDFLHYLARRSPSQPLLLLITYRHEEIQPALSDWLAQLDRERLAHAIRLVPLARSEVETMLASIFEERHTSVAMRRFLHGELLDSLSTLTEGNPFFVEEILSSLMAGGDIYFLQGYWHHRAGSAISIPRSVQDAVSRRTAQVSAAARHVLTLAAVAGRHFDFILLQQLTRYDEHQLLLLMKELVSARLVVEESADQFAFRHALTRQAIYASLLTRERRMLHQAIAEALGQQQPDSPNLRIEDLAYHFYQAQDWQKAGDYSQRAGEKALGLYAHRAAIDYFTWALSAARHLSLPPAPALSRARGRAYAMLGEFEQAQHDYTRALDAARARQDRAAEWQSMMDLGLLWTERDYGQAEVWLRQALVLAQSLDDSALHARSLNRIGNWHLNVEQPQEALHYHQEALTIFQQLQDSYGIAETLDLLGMTSYLGGDLIGGTAYYQQAVARWRSLGDKSGLTSSLATLALRGPTYQTDALVSAAGVAEGLRDAELALRIAREIGQRSAEVYALFQLGLCLGSQGEYGRAMAAVRQSLDIAEEIEHRQWQTAAHAVLGGIYSSLLAYQQACEHFSQALALAQEIGSLFWTRLASGYLASTAILLPDLARAETVLRAVPPADMLVPTMAQSMVWCASVELELVQGHPTRALEMLDQLRVSSKTAAEGQSGLRILKLRGEALVALQRSAEAEEAFKCAQELARTRGVRPLDWRLSLSLGHMYHAEGRSAEAEQAFAAARNLVEELAATIMDTVLRDHFLHHAMALLPRARTAPQSRSTKQTVGGLTEREREVVILLTQGKSNQRIADLLVVSKRTVETHIGNIMFKIGCTSRTQIAVWAVETGLVNKAEADPSS